MDKSDVLYHETKLFVPVLFPIYFNSLGNILLVIQSGCCCQMILPSFCVFNMFVCCQADEILSVVFPASGQECKKLMCKNLCGTEVKINTLSLLFLIIHIACILFPSACENKFLAKSLKTILV